MTLTLTDNFIEANNTLIHFPAKVGERIGDWTILGFWTNENKYLKSVKVQCKCGHVENHINVQSLKISTSTKCAFCAKQRSEANIWFTKTYGIIKGNSLRKLYLKKRDTRIFPNSETFDKRWLADYKRFAEYIAQLENFDKYPEYHADRIDNSRGYIEGNIQFVTRQVNSNNRIDTVSILFKNIEYSAADFIRLIIGTNNNDIYQFIIGRVTHRKTCTIDKALKELKYSNRSNLWPSKEIRDYFLNWYATNISE